MEPVERFPILKYFAFDHLPPRLADVSRPFCLLANDVANMHELPTRAQAAEIATALRKLLEAKDAAVRAMIP